MGIKSAPCVCVIQDPPNNSLLGGIRLREALTLRFEGRIPTFLEERATDVQKIDGYDIADWIQDQIIAGRSLVDIENDFVEAV